MYTYKTICYDGVDVDKDIPKLIKIHLWRGTSVAPEFRGFKNIISMA